jgi:hypothetical protein
MASEFEDDWVDQEAPIQDMADPAIRQANEQALGAFIMAHNEVDFYLSLVLRKLTLRMRPDNTLREFCKGHFIQRLNYLELLSAAEIINQDIDFKALRHINRIRNIVAHGYYEENIFDGEYILQEQKNFNNDRKTELRFDDISDYTKTLRKVASNLQMYGEFQHYIWPYIPRNDGGIGQQDFDHSQF